MFLVKFWTTCIRCSTLLLCRMASKLTLTSYKSSQAGVYKYLSVIYFQPWTKHNSMLCKLTFELIFKEPKWTFNWPSFSQGVWEQTLWARLSWQHGGTQLVTLSLSWATLSNRGHHVVWICCISYVSCVRCFDTLVANQSDATWIDSNKLSDSCGAGLSGNSKSGCHCELTSFGTS